MRSEELFYYVVQRIQQSYIQKEQELQAQREELQTVKQQKAKEDEVRGRHDREALTLLTQQAERAEDSARQLAAKLEEKVRIQNACCVCHIAKY